MDSQPHHFYSLWTGLEKDLLYKSGFDKSIKNQTFIDEWSQTISAGTYSERVPSCGIYFRFLIFLKEEENQIQVFDTFETFSFSPSDRIFHSERMSRIGKRTDSNGSIFYVSHFSRFLNHFLGYFPSKRRFHAKIMRQQLIRVALTTFANL